MMVIGLDPGMHCGFARFDGGKLVELLTLEPHQLLGQLELYRLYHPAVIVEDSRLQSHIWRARGESIGVACAMARSVGFVDGVCSIVEAWCDGTQCPFIGISPKGKGAKVDAGQFRIITGWRGRTSQHARDAAMVAWPYRMMSDTAGGER